MIQLEKLKEMLKDPKFAEETAAYFRNIREKKERNMNRMRNFFHDDTSFDSLMDRILKKHDDRWTDLCYKNGFMPYPWETFNALLNIVEEEGKEVGPLDGLTESFPSEILEYRGWTFAWTHGQGTCLSVYDKNKNLIYRD